MSQRHGGKGVLRSRRGALRDPLACARSHEPVLALLPRAQSWRSAGPLPSASSLRRRFCRRFLPSSSNGGRAALWLGRAGVVAADHA